jgi:type IV secretory pathway VirB3-like protein
MRTAKILKFLAFGILVLGIFIASKFFIFPAIEFWITLFISIILWVILRIIANIGQIVFDIKAELIRLLGNIERAIYYSNAIVKEIRDLIESDKENKRQ